MRFPDWIPLVVAHRRAATTTPWASIEHGLRESLRSGTTSLGEIATTDWRPCAVESDCPLPELVMFREALALDREAFDGTTSVATEFLAAAAIAINDPARAKSARALHGTAAAAGPAGRAGAAF